MAGAPSKIHLRQLMVNDSEEINELVSDWDQEYLQLHKGQAFWKIDIVQVGDFQFLMEHYGAPTLVRGQIPQHSFAIALPQFTMGSTVFMGHEVTWRTVLKSCWPYEFDIRANQQFKQIIIVAPVNQVLACAEAMQRPLEERDLSSTGVVMPDLTACQHLNQYLNNLFTWVKTQPQQLDEPWAEAACRKLIMADLLPLVVDMLTAKPVVTLAHRTLNYRQLARQAETYMQTHMDRPITLQTLCQHLAMSPRSLNYCFHEVFGLSPMETLKMLRLHQIRRVLRKADPTQTHISKIAPRFGFWHMAQLSADYKRMFGELPSATLKRGHAMVV